MTGVVIDMLRTTNATVVFISEDDYDNHLKTLMDAPAVPHILQLCRPA
jgi:hypothetical protein